MRTIVVALALVLWTYSQVALAQQGKPEDLKALSEDHQVRAVTYCQGVYAVTLATGASFQYGEFNLRFKTDSSEKGPAPGSPAIVPSGMMGDRAFLVFAKPSDMSEFIKEKC